MRGERVLDIGCGTGRDALFFKNKGLKPKCIDISLKMVELCKNKRLDAIIMDVENLAFDKESFHGIWAYTFLLYMPKLNFYLVLDEITELIKEEGIFYIGMKEGDFEGWINDERYFGKKRFFSLYNYEELRKGLERNFNIIHTSEVKEKRHVYLNYLCKKLS